MSQPQDLRQSDREPRPCSTERSTTLPACPVCGGTLVDIRHKLQCSRCRTICETCCEGGRG
ncbi:hypothetical protein GC176_05415 [bacterium]|nr:hypothetical protein [bacterium]